MSTDLWSVTGSFVDVRLGTSLGGSGEKCSPSRLQGTNCVYLARVGPRQGFRAALGELLLREISTGDMEVDIISA